MKQYLDLVRLIRDTGNYKGDRTGTGTTSIFAHQMRFDLADGFPLVTAKHTHLKSIIHELLWFLQGETNIRYLKENGVRIWDEWVLPGTAEYRDMTSGEIQVALVKHFNVTDFTPVQNDSLGLSGAYEIIRDEDDEDRIVFEYVDNASWLNAYRILLDKEPRVLIAGELGPVYGSQWRSWPNPHVELIDNAEEKARYMASGLTYVDWLSSGQARAHVKNGTIDQITNLIETLKKNPDSRRAIVSAWNPAEVDNMALPPCHCLFQFYSNFMSLEEMEDVIGKAHLTADYVRFVNERECETNDAVYDAALLFCQEHDLPRRKLSCQLYQRSADVFLGVPFNIASYALLLMMVAQVTNHVAGEFIWTGGDCHLYSNHAEQVELLLTRKTHPLPTMKINPEVKDIFGFQFSDFELQNYVSEPVIPAPVAV